MNEFPSPSSSSAGCAGMLPVAILCVLILIVGIYGVSSLPLMGQLNTLLGDLPAGRPDLVGSARQFQGDLATLLAAWLAIVALFGGAVYILLSRYLRINTNLEETVSVRTADLSRSLGELADRHRESRILNEMGDLLQGARSFPEAYEILARSGPQFFPSSGGGIYLTSPSRNMVEAAAVWGDTPTEAVFTPDDCWALRLGRIHHAGAGAPLCPHAAALPKETETICCILSAGGETLGILHLHWPAGRAPADIDERMVGFCEHVAMALSNLTLRDTLRRQSIRDPLTGLFNRRFLEESLDREIHRAKRNEAPLAVIMIDLDHFKRFNDDFGHDAGDAMLKALAGILGGGVREEDVPCRYGGEEFTLVMPNASLEIARERAEQIREQVAALHVEHKGVALPQVTASFGVAVFPQHGDTMGGLIETADKALYAAKEQGRNRVVCAP